MKKKLVMDEVKIKGTQGAACPLLLRSADYDAVAEGSLNVETLLERGVNPNATARCERDGVRPAPLWLAAAAYGRAAGMDSLRVAGCRFEAPRACEKFIYSVCLCLNPSLAQWYLDGAAEGGLPVPTKDHEREAAWIALGSMACRLSALEGGGTDVFDPERQVFFGDGFALRRDVILGLGVKTWDVWARELAKIAGSPTSGMLVNSAKMGMGSAVAQLLAAAPPSAEAAIEAGQLIEAEAKKGLLNDWCLVPQRGNQRSSRSEWSVSMEAGRILGLAGVLIDLDTAARTGNAYVLALALGSGSKPVPGREELALFVAAIVEGTKSIEEFLSIALGPILGHASKSGVALCAVEEMALAGCSYTAAPKKRCGVRAEPGAEVVARRYLKRTPKDDPMGYLAIIRGGPSKITETLGYDLALTDDQGLPSSIADFAKFVGRMAERERLGKALAPRPGSKVRPRRL